MIALEVLLALIIILSLGWFVHSLRLWKLASARGEISISIFSDYLDKKRIEPDVVSVVHAEMQRLLGWRRFPVSPNDNLRTVFGVGTWLGYSFEELSEDICGRLGIQAEKPVNKVTTVADLIYWLSEVYRKAQRIP